MPLSSLASSAIGFVLGPGRGGIGGSASSRAADEHATGPSGVRWPSCWSKSGSVKNWVTNHVQVFVVAGTFETGAATRPCGSWNRQALMTHSWSRLPLRGLPWQAKPGSRAAWPTTSSPNRRVAPQPSHPVRGGLRALPGDVRLGAGSAKVAAAAAAPRRGVGRPRTAMPNSPGRRWSRPPLHRQSRPPRAQAFNRPWVIAAALAGIVTLAALVWLLARRKTGTAPASTRVVHRRRRKRRSYPVVLHGCGWDSVGHRTRSSRSRASSAPRPIIHIETPGATQTQAEVLRQRAGPPSNARSAPPP